MPPEPTPYPNIILYMFYNPIITVYPAASSSDNVTIEN